MNTVVARLTGGLGNQMFQYANARTIADEHGSRLILDARRLDTPGMRPYELDNFEIRYDKIVRSTPIGQARTALGRRLQRRSAARSTFPSVAPTTQLLEPVSAPLSGVVQLPADNVEIVGWWQDPAFFARNARISEDFAPAGNRHRGSSQLTGQYGVVHIRRGDYLSWRNRKKYDVVSESYVLRQIHSLSTQFPGVPIYAVSDDRQWAERLPVEVSCSSTPMEDFDLIRNATLIACANSTFSWWAAWLSNARIITVPRWWVPLAERTVMYDDRWVFGDAL